MSQVSNNTGGVVPANLVRPQTGSMANASAPPTVAEAAADKSAIAAETLSLSSASRSVQAEKLDLRGPAGAALEAMSAASSDKERTAIGYNALLVFAQKSDSMTVRLALAALKTCPSEHSQVPAMIKDTLKSLKNGEDGSRHHLGQLGVALQEETDSFVQQDGDWQRAADKGLNMARVLESSPDPLIRDLATNAVREMEKSAGPEIYRPEVAYMIGRALLNAVAYLPDQPDPKKETIAGDIFNEGLAYARLREQEMIGDGDW